MVAATLPVLETNPNTSIPCHHACTSARETWNNGDLNMDLKVLLWMKRADVQGFLALCFFVEVDIRAVLVQSQIFLL